MRKSWMLPGLVALALVLAACGNLPTSNPAGTTLAPQSVEEVFPEGPSPFYESGEMVNETPAFWFVEFAGPPTAKGGSSAALRNQRAAFRSAAAAEAIRYQERFNFERLFNGISVAATPAEVGKLARLPGVVAVYPVITIDIPETRPGLEPDLVTALAMTGADVAQNELGLSGAGIRVAVMDTGIDYNHPDLGSGWGNRVVAGWDFVGDAFNAADPANNTPIPDPDPMDCNGHGTHVAGIVGANGQVVGVAPGVEFGAYKVFGCTGSTFADIMIAAMEMALADGMHVLNMSIGAAFQWPQYPTAVAASNLVDAGMVVVASIGNSGANGVYSASAPGVGEKVIGVASFDNSHINALSFSVNPSGQQVAYLTLATADDPPTSGTSPEVVWAGRGCTSLGDTLPDVAGKVALLVRGDCTFNEKYQGAANAGAAGVIIHNNVAGIFSGGGVTTRGIFGIGISQADGLHIRSLLTAGHSVTLTWTNVRINAPNPTGNLISSFSSYGLAPDLTLKPDIGAPGGLIRSTYPLALGGYATLSGTSMSAPHVAGAAALLLEAKPGLSANAVRDVFQNSATPRPWWGNPGLGFLDNVHRQGAGMLNVPGAVLATTAITPGKLSLGESQAGPATRTLTIYNAGETDVTYTLSFVNALSTGGSTFSPGFFLGGASVAFSAPSVTVPAGGYASVTATITAPAAPALGQYGGYIVFTPQGGGQVHRVPFAGFIGDYQALQVLAPTPFGFPWLAKLEDGFFINQPDGARFTMRQGDIAYVLAHFAHQSSLVKLEIVPLRQLGAVRDLTVFEAQYFGRNSTSTGFFAFEWDGSGKVNGRRTPLPMGDYQLRLSVLKALGDPNNPAHWETWTSPVITIVRSASR